MAASCQSPCLTNHNKDVDRIPKNANVNKNFFFVEPVSDMAPKKGAIAATIREPTELLRPR